MRILWIVSIFAIVATGGFLAYSNKSGGSSQPWEVQAAGSQKAAEVPIEELTGAARIWAKLRNAFDGKSSPADKKTEVASAKRDLGRLGKHFKSAPQAEN